jgi:hypothetical protein
VHQPRGEPACPRTCLPSDLFRVRPVLRQRQSPFTTSLFAAHHARAVRHRRGGAGGATGARAPHRQPRAGSEPARKASAGLPGNPVGLPETFAGPQAALRRPRNGDLCPAANLRPLSALAGASGHVPHRRSPHAAPLLALRRQRSQSGLPDLEPFALLPGAGRCHVKDGCATTSRRRQRRAQHDTAPGMRG